MQKKLHYSLQWLLITECTFCMSPLSSTPDLYLYRGSDSWNKCQIKEGIQKVPRFRSSALYHQPWLRMTLLFHFCFTLLAWHPWHQPQLKHVSKTRNGKGSLTRLMKFLCPLRQQTLQTPSDTPVWRWTRVSLNQLFHIIRRSLPNRLPIESHFE